MKSEGLSERSALEGRGLYSTKTNKLARVKSEKVEESDADDYYPFVLGHGRNCRVIDPKVYKQLRRHNIQPKHSVRIAECAKKSSNSPKNSAVLSRPVKTLDSADDEDEYCKLSPLAKGPALAPTLSKPSVLSNVNTMDLKRLPSFERRFFSDYDYKSKVTVVESNPSSPRPISKPLVPPVTNANKTEIQSEWRDTNESEKTQYCGMEADEMVDYATCMCCAKGLLYHCTKDTEDEGQVAEDPCSCSGPASRCVPRWLCVTVLSIFLPCLWCYLPVAGCRKVASCTKSRKTDKLKAKPTRRV